MTRPKTPLILALMDQCHEEFAVLSQFCAKIITFEALVTGSPSSKYEVYATACVYRELYGKITYKKCVNNYLN